MQTVYDGLHVTAAQRSRLPGPLSCVAMPWVAVIQWNRSPKSWATALDTSPGLVRCREELERYGCRQLWGAHCEPCRIYCDIFDFDDVVNSLHTGILLTWPADRADGTGTDSDRPRVRRSDRSGRWRLSAHSRLFTPVHAHARPYTVASALYVIRIARARSSFVTPQGQQVPHLNSHLFFLLFTDHF